MPTAPTQFLRTAGCVIATLTAIGCSEPTTGRIVGAVAVDGASPKTGSIAFFPIDGKGTTAGSAIVEGHYVAEASLGKMRVEIRVPKVVGQKKLYDMPDSPVKDLMEESLPARFNDRSELTIDVKPGENRQDFDLSTK